MRPARVMEIAYQRSSQSLVLAGTVVPRIESTLGFRVAGKIVARAVDVGTVVKAGQLIAELDPTDYRLAVENARAAYAAADADYMRAKADHERYLQLRSTRRLHAADARQRQSLAATALGRIDQAKSQLDSAENNLAYTELRADAPGVITAVQAEVGQVMAQGQGVVRVARTDELEILVGVPEHRLKAVREAEAASFELWSDPGHRHAAKLRELSPSADPMTRTYPARFSVIDKPAFIGLGMTATLSFERPDAQPVAEVPLAAIFQHGTQPAVWVVDRAERHRRAAARHDRALARRYRRHRLGREGRRDDRHRGRAQARGRPEGEAGAAGGALAPLPGEIAMTTRTNLSALALNNSTLTVFFMLALIAAGIYAFFNLGRGEDPPFTIKQMVVSAAWPGATAREVEQQVTEKIETKLQELPYFYNVTSYTKPGETVIYVSLRDDTPPAKVADLWYQVRKKVGDIKGTLPQGVDGPFFNDEYGDTYSLIWAFESDGFSPAEVKEIVKEVRQRLLRVPDVTKADLFGLQDEKIYIEFSHTRLAMLGVPVDQILEVVRKQNAIVATGTVETKGERVSVRVDGAPITAEELAALPFSANGRTLTLADVAKIKRGYQDPPQISMRFGGKPVIGLGVVMAPGGNVQTLGKALEQTMAEIEASLPVGITVHRVANQPEVVENSFEEFIYSLVEALAIVLVVSFVSLGVRTGVIVALSVPLVLAITFVGMMLLGIDFQRISLGALIIALGLLVDDAIIAVEMMMVKLEQGSSRIEAATYRLHLDRLPDADRHAGHRDRLRAGGLRQVERRRIHQLDLLGGRPLADHLVVRGRAVHAVDGLPPAAAAQGAPRRPL